MPQILLVDDDIELCELLAAFLAGEGFRVDAVHSGAAGVDRAMSGTYALVLLDVMLPATNGFDVLLAIRAHSRVPVVMLTAKGEILDRVRGLEIGADDYLAKPFDPHELAARIRAVLRRTSQDRPLPVRAPIVVDDLELEPAARKVRVSGERSI